MFTILQPGNICGHEIGIKWNLISLSPQVKIMIWMLSHIGNLFYIYEFRSFLLLHLYINLFQTEMPQFFNKGLKAMEKFRVLYKLSCKEFIIEIWQSSQRWCNFIIEIFAIFVHLKWVVLAIFVLNPKIFNWWQRRGDGIFP